MKNMAIITSFLMVITCAALAYYLYFTNFLSDKLYGPRRTIMTALLVVYGLYRSYRIYVIIQKERRSK